MIINIDTLEYTVEVRDDHVSVVLKDIDGYEIELRLPKEPIKIPESEKDRRCAYSLLSGYVKELHSAIWPGLRFP